MENNEIGFKKNKKSNKPKEDTKEDLRSTFNPTCHLEHSREPSKGTS